MITQHLPIADEKTTAARFLTSRTFCAGGAVVMTLVAGSAAVAHQQIVTIRPNALPSAAAAARASVPPPLESPRESTPPVAAMGDTAPPPATGDPLLSPADGLISSVFVTLGDRVGAGQPLATVVSTEGVSTLAQLADDVEHARRATREIERSLAALDKELAAAVAARVETAAESAREMASTIDDSMQAALSRAEMVYTDAVARERRAAVLGAHGVRAFQELEAAQRAVRTAAGEVARLRRAVDMATSASAADTLRELREADARIAAQQRQREERAAALDQARRRQRDAETALAFARERLAVMVRSRLAGTVVSLAIQPGTSVTMGTELALVQP